MKRIKKTVKKIKLKKVVKISGKKRVTVPSTRRLKKPSAVKRERAAKKPVKKVPFYGPGPQTKTAADLKFSPSMQLGSGLQEKETAFLAQTVQELPRNYGKDRLIVLTRDPRWLYVYWELGGQKNLSGAKFLRVYDVTQVDFNGANAHSFFDVEVPEQADNWYVDTLRPARSWCVELGTKDPAGEFRPLLRSNTVTTPLEGPSEITDEEWMIPEATFARLYGIALGAGIGQTSPAGKIWQEKIINQFFSGMSSRSGSLSSPGRKVSPGSKFWLAVDCELIVYGATEPDARVTVQGAPVKIRKDGTFSLRFALPDGRQTIPVEGVSFDGKDKITIIPVIRRFTR